MPPRNDDPRERVLEPAALDRLWDAMNRQIAPVGGRAGSASLDAAETISWLIERDDAPHLAASEIDRLWSSLAATVLAQSASTVASATAVYPDRARQRRATAIGASRSLVRQTAIGVMAGFLVGFVVIGGGLRILMRVAALLTGQSASPMVTENGNTVGAITLDGTLALLVFSGAVFGMIGGIAVMAVRPWLPASGWQRVLLIGMIGFAVAGPAVLEAGENTDYQRFGILGLNVCLFTLLPFCFGITVLPVIDWLDRTWSPGLPAFDRGWRTALKSFGVLLLNVPALLLVPLIVRMPPVALLLALPIVRALGPIWLRYAPTLERRRTRERWEIALGRLMLATSCLVGLALMAQAIERLTG